ncbi:MULTISPECIES: response regulator transcription factor [Stenotrophomonas]|uniref:Response regulator transcription factor n=1 Tax=Stenotrophomonas maltophilia TaxID=40324 RepID=A0AAI9C3S4_STEMA|nr:response regulator transcription factor [Stenotrophomonas maltophilia]UUS15906.1 response regulator transcription factor [Stenotrophomonas sp. CD2]AWT13659.1 DNA-binding response regulator [Stenotrophomonas maltophilia]EKT4093585.1 response regulator transcription factor [Stenotrophomonas maltophilia]MBA0360382.1 DNA-binding response regulator [Stenotrophomonas maltophilia]HEL4101303.1 response regulator transcription factor [Stenotrophomonas maltophilia]
MPRVLTIEDDLVTAEEIATELRSHGFDVDLASDGSDGLALARAGDYAVITLDRMLPGIDGLALVTTLRREGITTPVLMISALSDVDERVRGLRAGGDDYLTKPFASDEMAARVEVLIRRQAPAIDNVLRAGDLELDLMTRSARRGGHEIALLPTEFKLLEFLVRNAGQVVTRSMLFQEVWGYHFDPGTNLIDVHIGRVRKRIEQPGRPQPIMTVRGTGYVFDAQS